MRVQVLQLRRRQQEKQSKVHLNRATESDLQTVQYRALARSIIAIT